MKAFLSPGWLVLAVLTLLPLSVVGQTYEQRVMAAVLMGEAWSQGTRGMTAVAEVVHQRSVDTHQTPLQVVLRPAAFSCLNGTTPAQLLNRYESNPDFPKALRIARVACLCPKRLPGITRHANHYVTKNLHPYWTRHKKPVAVVGAHAFYRL